MEAANTKRNGKSFYVRAITMRGRVCGYGVYDFEGGIEIEHKRFMAGGVGITGCLDDANRERDRMNRLPA